MIPKVALILDSENIRKYLNLRKRYKFSFFSFFSYSFGMKKNDSEYVTHDSVYATEKSKRGTKIMVYATHQIVRGVFTRIYYSRVLYYGIARYA